MIRAAIVGGSGYVGGELLRLLLGHPEITVSQITSRQHAGRYVHSAHPNLRGQTLLKFTTAEMLEPCDVLFLALPHGMAATQIDHFAGLAERIVDLSADFRLRDPDQVAHWYGRPHPAPAWLPRFTYGLPELTRAELAPSPSGQTRYVSGVGCNATAIILALLPLARAGLIESAVVDLKVGSSEGGNAPSLATHHPERSGALRTFAPVHHRHQAEVFQALGEMRLHFTATAIEMVRGVLCTAHVFLNQTLEDKDIWRLYRQAYGQEPFVRLVKERQGLYRYPEPKILAGSNFCDVGFEREVGSNRLVVISALDNLMKGAAGSAIQALNVMMGWPENTGLTFSGLHPV
jgi:N-acetyl-gamma-glutamyl-phosphate/LysW-gamma-L-alpha-aminoadipyl-6-phosphate reductase